MNSALTQQILKWGISAIVAAVSLWLVFNIYATGQAIWAAVALGLISICFFVYLSNIGFAYRYLFPGLAAMLIFVAFPLFYTVQIGFTNYSSNNLLSLERASTYLLDQTIADEARTLGFTLHADGKEFRLLLKPEQSDAEQNDPEQANALLARSFISPPLALLSPKKPTEITMLPLAQGSFQVAKHIRKQRQYPRKYKSNLV